jgi:hypothetical protein
VAVDVIKRADVLSIIGYELSQQQKAFITAQEAGDIGKKRDAMAAVKALERVKARMQKLISPISIGKE